MKTKRDFSCGGVVWNSSRGELLLIHTENLGGDRVWTFPKGHPEQNESGEDAAIREVLEETGWKCEIDRPLTEVKYFFVRDNVRYLKTVRWFLMKPLEKIGEFATGEVLATQWVKLDEAKRLISYKSDRELVKEVEEAVKS